MPDLAFPMAAAAALAIGYLLGRTRPLRAARTWAWWTIIGGPPSNAHALAALALHPREAWRAWRRRNTPRPPRRTPAPDLSPFWQDKLNNGDHRA